MMIIQEKTNQGENDHDEPTEVILADSGRRFGTRATDGQIAFNI
jgi:hypothetical protein